MAIIRIAITLYFWLFTLSIIHNCIICSSNNSNEISCIETERQTLVSLKQDLYGPSNRLVSWVGEDCCKWFGIICNNITGHVHKLILRGPSPINYFTSSTEFDAYEKSLLGGKISPALLNLKHLHHLDLSNNDFGGNQIPKFLGSSTSLRCLNLSGAGFDGMIPHQIGNLTNLRTLDLNGATKFNGYAMNIQWISHLSSLRYLDMSHVELHHASDWIEVTNSLPSLVVLRLSGCNLSYDSIPPIHHINFSSLAILDLSYNVIYSTSIPKWVLNIRSLTSLDLSGNDFIGPISEGIQNLTSLMHLDLSGNHYTSSIPNSLYGLSHLEFLNLQGNQLSGTISSDIKNLTSIISLVLSSNELEGKLPTVGTQLCKLKEIDLSFNKWNQSISQVLDSLCGCVSDRLDVLHMHSNQLFGRLDRSQILKFKALTQIYLGSNSISGPIPSSLGNISSLIYMDLSMNHFNGSLPESFGQLAKIEWLDISNNYLEGTITEAHFANAKKLRWIYASDNQLTLDVSPSWIPPFQLEDLYFTSFNLGPQFPLWLRSQEHLIHLDISNIKNDVIVVPSWFWNFSSQLAFLNLSHSNFQGRIPYTSKIGNDQLEIDLSYNYFLNTGLDIDLSYNHFEGLVPCISSNVISIDLSNNNFSGSISHFLCNKSWKLMNLEILRLANNQLSGQLPDCWSKWQNLSIINLSSNKFSGNIPSSIESLIFLRSLHLRNNNLSGEIPISLQNCTELFTLDIGENNLRGSIPAWIGSSLLKMRIISLRFNEFYGHLPNQLCVLNSLQILDVSCNYLSGHLPTCFNNFSIMAQKSDYHTDYFSYIVGEQSGMEFIEDLLIVMKGKAEAYNKILRFVKSMDLSSNHLSGHIPSEMMSLSGLISLNLSNNHLVGEIPKQIGEMKALESIDFSQNQLSGGIPQSMSTMSFLSHLNLSHNNLTGMIPLGTQLQGLDPSSFAGNNLCGPPLTSNCNTSGGSVEKKNIEDDDCALSWPWFYIGMGVGFATGFWGVCGALIFNKTWRYNCFRFLDYMTDKIYVVIALKLRWFHQKLRRCYNDE
ncbi:hypothetical protein FNV43_RR27140 [Rhamnella rubrinervis]|uniref:Leucine-rich repeat-containing N-terminal plant-type domain-containing protein n=1 Tax=Rhamnella rubrinervis TaxID=2594499 RepID=A0A8K0GS94_9ROSA|nr:hypothetical protein FNV43_RR27140 [Rhamnella rubrinervis]